jgi:glutamine amidotransferase
MQTLFESSEEAPGVEGMGVIKGTVPKFKGNIKVPHMGWNSIEIMKNTEIFDGIKNWENFYFVHSYYCQPEEDVIATKTRYGMDFASSVQKGNIFACQFHPEKSQKVGIRLLQNFINMCR